MHPLLIFSGAVRRGWSLVECLVVLSIIGVLTSLLLPAVQAVRESARKTVCQNNLRQIGIGLYHFHGTHQRLPIGCLEWRAWNSPSSHRQLAWSAFLLPFLEQGANAEQIQWDQAFDSSVNQLVGRIDVPIYICPSESHERSIPGRISYGGVFGETMTNLRQDDGTFLNEIPISFRDIYDGLTSTIAVAEDVGGPDNFWINGRNIFVQSGGINDPAAWIGDNEIRSAHPGGAMVLFLDSRPVFLSESIERSVLGRLITRDNGDVVSAASF